METKGLPPTLLKTWECTFCLAINVIGDEECCVCFMPKEDVVVFGPVRKALVPVNLPLTDMPLLKS